MQTMIYVLQQQLKDTKEQLVQAQEDNAQLRLAPVTAATVVPPTDVKPIVKKEEEVASEPNSPIRDTVTDDMWTTHSDSKYESSQQSHDCHMDNAIEQLETPGGNGNGELETTMETDQNETDEITSSDPYNCYASYTNAESTEQNHATDQNDLSEQWRTTKTDAQLYDSTDDLSQEAWKPTPDQSPEESALKKSHEELDCSPDAVNKDKLGDREQLPRDVLHVQNGVNRTSTCDGEMDEP